MQRFKIALSNELRARLDAASKKSGESVAEEIRRRVEASFTRDADVDKPTRDLVDGLALMPAEIERETGAVWHKHAGAYEVLRQAIQARLDELRPKGSTSAFGDRPHATVFEADPNQLASMIEYRLRRQPDFTNSSTRQLMADEHQRMKLAQIGLRLEQSARGRKPPVSLLNEPLDQPKKGGKR